MISKNKAITFASIAALLITVMIAALMWLSGVYRLEPAWLVVIQTLAILFVFAITFWGIFLVLRREKVNKEEKQLDNWRVEEIKRLFNLVWRKHGKLFSNPYAIPWYVHLTEAPSSEQLWLQQMGFEQVEPSDDLPEELVALRFWASDSAIMVTIDLSKSKESLSKSYQLLIELVLVKRARQAFNGILCSVSLGSLLDRSEISVSELSQKYRAMLEELNHSSGLTLPVYCAFTDMSQVKDLCELFSPLDENERDLPFGVLRNIEESHQYDKAWFDQSFEQLMKNVAGCLPSSLKHQLNADYRDAALAGVFQLSALRYEIEDFLSLTFNQHQFHNVELFFRGYFLVNSGGDNSARDIVSAMHAADFGYDSMAKLETPNRSLSLFAKDLFSACILKESTLVGVNKKKEVTYRASRWVVVTAMVALFVGFVSMLRAGYLYQQDLDAKAQMMLTQYKENLSVNKIQPDDLASPVFSLFELREIVQLYEQDNHPWYISSWLPNSSIQEEVTKAYYRELKSELLTLMRDYLMKDMFVYNSLDDKVKTLELLNLQQILYNAQRQSPQPLVDYYTQALNEEGSGYANLIERFQLLAKDVLATSATPPAFDEQLLKLVKSSLSSNDVSELLYQHIMQHQEFAKRVDIRKQLNPSYEQVFHFSDDFSGYLIPYVFTRDGFEELSDETGFQLASQAIQDYEGVMGRINGDAEMNRINRQLRDRYVKDYIRYWMSLTNNVHLTEVNSWGGSEQQLALVTDANFSPLFQFYQLIDVNTNLSKSPDEKQLNTKSEEQSTSPVTSSEGVAMEKVAESISFPFRHLHQVIEANQTGQSHYDIAIGNLNSLRDWTAKSKEIQFKGHYFLEQLENKDASNPVAQLNRLADDYNVPILPELMQQQASLVNGLALDSVREVINQDWSSVSEFYQARLANHYPFSSSAASDAKLADVEAFFKPNGEFDRFAAKYASQLDITVNRELFIQGFIPHQYLALSWQYQPLNDAITRIQQQMFDGNKLGFKFAVKAVKMSPDITRFALTSSSKLFEYQNGPKLWRTQAWPIPSNQQQEISILLEDTLGVMQRSKQAGVWSWFKVADKMHASTQVGSNEMVWRYQSGMNEVNLLVRGEGTEQPLDSSYFSQLSVPSWL